LKRIEDGVRGEARGSGLWGTGRGGRGSDGRRSRTVKRGLVLLLVMALAAPLAASAGGGHHSWKASYLAPSLVRAATQTPNTTVAVIVQSTDGTGEAVDALHAFSETTRKLPIVGAAAAEVVAGDLPEIAEEHNLVITPDQAMVFDGKPVGGPGVKKPKPYHNPHQSGPYDSSDVWPAAVGVDQLWPGLPGPSGKAAGTTPTIAFVDSGIEAARNDFGDRILAAVDLTTLPGNSPGDGRGHGTIGAGVAAGSAPGRAGAAPTAGIVSLDVMDDQGMARTSDVIAATQWILRNRKQYDIRVANFSLHSASPSSFRWAAGRRRWRTHPGTTPSRSRSARSTCTAARTRNARTCLRGRPGATRSTAFRSRSSPPPAARSSGRFLPTRRWPPSARASC
jgi:hypothetical protein